MTCLCSSIITTYGIDLIIIPVLQVRIRGSEKVKKKKKQLGYIQIFRSQNLAMLIE